jgi:hypothetical protein
MVLKLNKLIRPTIAFTVAVSITITKNIIEVAGKRWGIKL